MMEEKEKQESQAEQSERFRNLVQSMVDAGELNPTEAEEKFEQAMSKIANSSIPPSSDGSGD
jgi:polyhydroxyalkanoate synthesis regulator phasin